MRMRRKRNFDSRMDNILDYVIIRRSTNIFKLPEEERYNYLDYKEIFGNDNPVYLEIGCGLGRFICELAKKHPERNYLAVEKVGNVIISAAERAQRENITNVRFLNIGAEILNYFLKPNSICDLYLNFSCPFPKNAYENRRLTFKLFLERYKVFLKKDSIIEQKTDNVPFFDYSYESLNENGFEVIFKTYDLYSQKDIENIQTEYEEKFSSQGMKICKLIAKLK